MPAAAAAAAPAVIAVVVAGVAAVPVPGANEATEFVTFSPAGANDAVVEVATVAATVAPTVITPAALIVAVCPVSSAVVFPPAVTVTSPGAQSRHVTTSPLGPVEYKPTVPRTASCEAGVTKR